MTKLRNKKVVSTNGEYLGKIKNFNYEENVQELVIKKFGENTSFISTDRIVGVDDVVVVNWDKKNK